MHLKIDLAGMMAAAALLIILGSGCASPPAGHLSPAAQPAAVQVEQVPITSYMRSREGTPDELSPLAPAEARCVRKVGHKWICNWHGQTMVFNDATSRWESQPLTSKSK
jgi:hypothetical protein